MYFILYILPYSFCNTPVHISYLVVYESRSLRRRVHLLSALFSEQTIEPKDYGLPAVICVCMFFILYIPPFISVTPLLIFLIWLCMKAVAYDIGCVRLPDSE